MKKIVFIIMMLCITINVVQAQKSGENSIVKEELEEDELIYIIVEEMPIFMPEKCNTKTEGQNELSKWISNNIRYPEVAHKNKIQGKVYVRFVITKSGDIDQVSLARGVSPELNKEALRVVNELPEWKPGSQRGKNVNVWYTVPVYFILN